MKMPTNATVYPMPVVEKAMITLESFCIHQSDIRIPTYITTEKPIDAELMSKALNIEIQRNDSLRIFFQKKMGKVYDYFVPEIPKTEFPVFDFSDKSEAELESWLSAEAKKPLKYLKGSSYRIYQFITPKGHHGIYLIVCHASMDLYGILAFYNDLMAVYDALEKGAEMPKAMTRYEDLVKSQLEMEGKTDKPKKDLEFFAEKFKSQGPSFYAGIDCMKQLNETRKRKKDDKARYIDLSLTDPFNDASAPKRIAISAELAEKMQKFCLEHNTSMQNLFYIGMRTYLSKVNELTDDVNFHFLSHRRTKASEKRCGGSCATVLPLRTIIGKEETFASALHIARVASIELLRHIDAPTFELLFLPDKIEHRRTGATTASMMFTVCPPQAFTCSDGWKPFFGTVSTGYFPFIAYAIVLPNPATGGLTCHYEYRTHRFTEENIINLHEGAMKVIEAGMANPEITIKELLFDVL